MATGPNVTYAAEVDHVREVSLRGSADLAYWQARLNDADLTPLASGGRAQILIIAAGMKVSKTDGNGKRTISGFETLPFPQPQWLEGMMLSGAFFGILAAQKTGSWPLGLLAAPVLQWIEAGVPATERADCCRTIELAVRCRDAFAHGAIVTFDAATREAYGAVIVKALYLVLAAAMHHGV